MKKPEKTREVLCRWILILLAMGFLSSVVQAADVMLHVNNKSGNDGKYEQRDRYNTGSWGIKGDGSKATVWDGNIWFNSFPGESGKYKIIYHVILEADGQSPYKVTAGGRTLKEDAMPYAGGTYKCNTENYDAKGTIDLGTHQINKGEKINVWGKSVYKCQHSGSWHGAYARCKQLEFKFVSGTTSISETNAAPSISPLNSNNPEETLTLFTVSGLILGTYPFREVTSGQVSLPDGLYLSKSRMGLKLVTIHRDAGR